MQADPAPRAALSVYSRRAALVLGVCLLGSTLTMRGTPHAIAQGETRTLTFVQNHTKESATITFKRWGSYDYSALDQLNWIARDWRRDEKVRMNPKLFDVLWEAHREAGSSSPIYINSAYRSPDTNAMLRRRSRAVAKHSQHMEGNAMDFYLADVSMSRIREIAMRMQRGGVGYYPSANTPFVHLDVGSVRSWPRMSRDQLARIFPDERTVHLPAGGGVMAGYEEAKAVIIARGGSVGGYSGDEEMEGFGGGAGFFAALFGRGGGGGGGGGSSGGDDAGVRSIAMGNVRAGQTVVASAEAPAATRSLRGRRGRAAQEVQVAAAAPAPAPAPAFAAAQPSPIFSLFGGSSAPPPAAAPQPAPVAVAARPQEEAPAARRTIVADLPMPPTRPPEFARATVASLANIPMPPLRPSDLAPPPRAEAAIAAVIRPSASPTPASAAPTPPTRVAAYAPVETPLPPIRPSIRSGAIIGASAAAVPAPVALKPTTTEKQTVSQQAQTTSRARTLSAPAASKVALAPVDAILMEFRRKADIGPSVGQFSGAAVKPMAQTALRR